MSIWRSITSTPAPSPIKNLHIKSAAMGISSPSRPPWSRTSRTTWSSPSDWPNSWQLWRSSSTASSSIPLKQSHKARSLRSSIIWKTSSVLYRRQFDKKSIKLYISILPTWGSAQKRISSCFSTSSIDLGMRNTARRSACRWLIGSLHRATLITSD